MSLSSEWKPILDRLIEREGGYINHPSDPGGRTKFGISQKSYPGLDIRNLTIQDARSIYEHDFVAKYGLDRCVDPRTREWVLDWLVNSGPYAIKKIQQGLRISVDGVMGPQTIQALNDMPDPRELLIWRLKFFVGLTKHPFIAGWVNRLVELGL